MDEEMKRFLFVFVDTALASNTKEIEMHHQACGRDVTIKFR